MTFTAVIILIASAFVHAGWNLIGKKANPTIGFFLTANFLGTLCLLPLVIAYYRVAILFSYRVWLLLLSTGLCQAVYYSGLTGAYRKGDMSLAYPMIRAFPVLFVALISLSMGKWDQLTRKSMIGIALIFFGAFLLPMRRFIEFRWTNYLNRVTLLAVLAAMGTTGYSVIDDTALRLVREQARLPLKSWQITLVYAFFEGMASSFWLTIFVSTSKRSREALKYSIRSSLGWAAIMGFGIYLTYSLVLISMAFVKDVSYVVAFRQLSIPLGVVLSVFLLKEKAHVPKFAGVFLILAGLALVGLG
jgi:drug/metabolite transporter (DMT)-like permease